jgi:hypothetical protein
MPIDLDYLRQHYSDLSDRALLEVNRADLVEVAQQCYDEEVQHRQLDTPVADLEPDDQPLTDAKLEFGADGESDKPVWFDEGAEVFSQVSRPGSTGAPEADSARNALEAADIPCYLDVCDEEELKEEEASRSWKRWRLMVPGALNLRATSVLERDIFNEEFEAIWRTHLEMLSDEDLGGAHPKVVFCGLFDRVERVIRVYNDEAHRRGLAARTP